MISEGIEFTRLNSLNPLSASPTKLFTHTETIRRQYAEELFECV